MRISAWEVMIAVSGCRNWKEQKIRQGIFPCSPAGCVWHELKDSLCSRVYIKTHGIAVPMGFYAITDPASDLRI